MLRLVITFIFLVVSTFTYSQELESYAQLVNEKISEANQSLETLAEDPQLIVLFKEADKQKLESYAATAIQLFPAGLKLRLLSIGDYPLDTQANPPLSFATIESLKRAEDITTELFPEAYYMGQPTEHVSMISRVFDNEKNLLGFVQVSLSLSYFVEDLLALSDIEDYIELQQTLSGKSASLYKLGDKTQRNDNSVNTAIEGSVWQLAYWQKSLFVATNEEDTGLGNMLYYLLGLLVLLIAAGLVWFKQKSTKQTIPIDENNDSGVVYAGAVKAIAEGVHEGARELIPNLPSVEDVGSSGSSSVEHGISTGLEDTDVTQFASKEGSNNQKQEADIEETPINITKEINDIIFRAYDIRGIVGDTLTVEAVYSIGRALGTLAERKGQKKICVGRDGRVSSPELADALKKGLMEAGREVIDIGLVPTPVLYFSTYHLETGSGVMITGSHNAPEYNGLKIMLDGQTLFGENIQEIKQMILEGDFHAGEGSESENSVDTDYVRRIADDIPVSLSKALRIVVDAGNGAAGQIAPQLFSALGHDVVPMYCEIDGEFPNHHPDPSQPENLKDLIEKVKSEEADIGFAFDGDGDRVGVIDSEGNIIWPDKHLMLLAKDVLSRNKGASIIFDVKCSRYLKAIIEASGGKPLMWKTGHSFIKTKMKEVESPLAGEMSGHIFFKERWYGFDDALYTAARTIEILLNEQGTSAEVFDQFPSGVSTPELRLRLDESRHAEFMQKAKEQLGDVDAEIIEVDGLRVEYKDGWVLMRGSNTSPYIIMRFEAENQKVLSMLQDEYRTLINAIDSDLDVPY